jgi:glycosyltransferase involved in cell wall biosynthesis
MDRHYNMTLKILLIGNYAPDQQQSMLGFANALQTGLCARGVEVRALAPRVAAGRLRVPKMGKWLGYADKLLLFPAELRRAAKWADVVHICDQGNAMYTRYLADTPHLVTCHDLLAIRSAQGELADWKTGASGKRFQAMILNGLKGAQHIACVSETTRQDLLRLEIIPPERASRVYNGQYGKQERMPETYSAKVLEKASISLDRPFLLHVGGNQLYKNRLAVLQIFQAFASLPEGKGHLLVMAGKPFTPEMRQYVAREELRDSVRELISPTSEVIGALYSRAQALVFPSLYEGFGLPIIEAQACGCPVFTSNRAPMTEIGGEAAVYFDPEQPQQAARVLQDNWSFLPALREKGLLNARRFTPQHMLDGYLAAYQRVLH